MILKKGSLATTKIPIMVKPNTQYNLGFTYYNVSSKAYGDLLVTDQNGKKIFNQNIRNVGNGPLSGGKTFKTNDNTIGLYISFEGREGDGSFNGSIDIKNMFFNSL
ncbi:hypothetical protein IAW_06088 [Bacillus cereus str. Schrouff]|uniref:hypothetical protein n=1 Tax=Bacillus cereus TaxID=1396 RepID=UPI00032FA22C|nr:hypothetical protein [Bacillus cereus]EOO04684.1 hypothetical protein IAW_06088 [Bacillus cereus str. Schrouff]EOO81587.1 hypothetical protein IGY_05813 [Bacillus cereus K-5975c]